MAVPPVTFITLITSFEMKNCINEVLPTARICLIYSTFFLGGGNLLTSQQRGESSCAETMSGWVQLTTVPLLGAHLHLQLLLCAQRVKQCRRDPKEHPLR